MWPGETEGDPGGGNPPGGKENTKVAETSSDLSNLEIKFQEQQELIGQLKDRIKDKESRLQTQKRDVQDYSERLARMKPKFGRSSIKVTSHHQSKVLATSPATDTKGSKQTEKLSDDFKPTSQNQLGVTPKNSPTTKKAEASPKEDSSTPSSSRSKILLLRKQLEENRLKFERQQREKSDNKAAMDEMKEKINSLRSELESRDTLISSLQDGENQQEPTSQHLYHQIMLKDSSILELSQKVIHLEGVLQEQKEMLDEKDKVIKARTEAVALIAKDRDEKNMKIVDEIEDLRIQMIKMQENFTLKEENWVVEKNNMNKTIEDKHKKITQLEENCRRIENVRFELSARNAELQEKIVKMQSSAEDLKKEIKSERKEHETKEKTIKELRQELNRATSFGQKKLKNLEKQVRSFKDCKGEIVGNQILELQNRIAEIEEEKGNALLKLVDFDDLKGNYEKLLNQRTKLEEKASLLEKELESQLASITRLEGEKIKLVEGINNKDDQIYDLDTTISNLQAERDEVKQAKVKAELKLCVIEEQIDKIKKQDSNEIETGESIASLNEKVCELEKINEQLSTSLKEKQFLCEKNESLVKTLTSENEIARNDKQDKEDSNRRLLSILAEKESTITSQSIKIDRFDDIQRGLEDRLSSINKELADKLDELEKMAKQCDSETQKNHQANILVMNLESKITQLGDDIQTKELEVNGILKSKDDLSQVINERDNVIKGLELELSSLSQQIQDKEAIIQDYLSRIEEMEERLSMKQDEVTRLARLVKENENNSKSQSTEIDKLTSDLSNTMISLNQMKCKFDNEIQSLNAALESNKNELDEKSTELLSVKQEVLDQKNVVESMQSDYEKINDHNNSLSFENSALIEKNNALIEERLKLKEENDRLIENNTISSENLNKKEESLLEQSQNIHLLKSTLDEKNILIQNISEENAKFKSDYELIFQENNNLKQDVEIYCNQLQEHELNISNIKQELSNSVAKFNEETEIFKSNSSDQESLLETLRGEIREKDISLKEMYDSNEKLKETLNETENALIDYQNNQSLKLKNKENELRQELDIKINEISQLNEHITLVTEELNNIKETAEQYNNLNISNMNQIKELEFNYSKKLEEINEVKLCNEQLVSDNDSIQLSLEQSNNKIQHLEQEVNGLKNSDSKNEYILQENSTLLIKLQDLESQSLVYLSEIESLKSLNLTTSNELQLMKDLEVDNRAVVEKLQASLQQIEHSERELKNRLEKQETDLHFNSEQFEAQVSDYKSRISILENEKLHLQEIISNLDQPSESTNPEILKENAELKQQILELQQQTSEIPQSDQPKVTVPEISHTRPEGNTVKLDEFNSENISHSLPLTSSTPTLLAGSAFDAISDSFSPSVTSNFFAPNTSDNSYLPSNVPTSNTPPISDMFTQGSSIVDSFTQQSNIFDSIAQSENISQHNTISNTSDLIQSQPSEGTQDTMNFDMEEAIKWQSECNTLKSAVKNLEASLVDANNTITSLETTLATQATYRESRHNSSGGWGEVDLGDPEPTYQITEMQKALTSKDEMITVAQERLKDTIEKMNTIHDEKKLIEHQLNTELETRKRIELQIKMHEEQLSNANEMKSSLDENKLTIQQLQTTIHELQNKLDHYELNKDSGNSNIIASNDVLKENAACDWFNQNSSNEQTTSDLFPIQNTQVSSEDPRHTIPEENTTKTTEPLTSDQPQPSEGTDNALAELQYKLSWYEEQWPTWTTHYAELQETHQQAQQQIVQLTEKIQSYEKMNDNLDKIETLQTNLTSATEKIELLEKEIQSLRELETEFPQLQSHIQTLQHECGILKENAAKAELEKEKLLETEVLYGELQGSTQETIIKLEGSRSRVHELELMVQSAESEITRLKNQIDTLNSIIESQGNNDDLLKMGEKHKEEIQSKQNDVMILQGQVQSYTLKLSQLEGQFASLGQEMANEKSIVQQLQSENNVLHSEVEVLGGDLSRLRTDFEILESENNRSRGEVEMLTQSNQISEAEKESFETEVQRLRAQTVTLTSERDHLRGETQRLSEVETSAESEITRLRKEIEQLRDIQNRYSQLQVEYEEIVHKLNSRGHQLSTEEFEPVVQVEEVDWGAEGKIEAEHIQMSSPDPQIYEEIETLKNQIIELEKDKIQLADEGQTARIKHGKVLQKLKIVQSKNEKLQKELKAKSGGFSDLDKALEEEWKAQIKSAEEQRDELKLKLDEIEKEKSNYENQLDVLQSAQEKYIDMKEMQDNEIQNLSVNNKSLTSQIQALEWKISELEEQVNQTETSIVPVFSNSNQVFDSFNVDEDQNILKQQVLMCQQSVQQLTTENSELKQNASVLQEELSKLSLENKDLQNRFTQAGETEKCSDLNEYTVIIENLQIQVEELTSEVKATKELLQKAENDSQNYKTTYLELHSEHDSLKEEKEKLGNDLETLKYDHLTLKAAYDTLYEGYSDVQDERDNLKNSLGIVTGERDRLIENVESQKNQLDAMQEMEENEVIHNLQQECFNLRYENDALKEEITMYVEKIRVVEESAEKDRTSVEKSVEVQEYLQQELMSVKEELTFNRVTCDHLEKQISYLQAESNAFKTQATQHTQAQEQMVEQIEKLQKDLEESLVNNQQLLQQVNAADASLAKISAHTHRDGDIITTQPISSVPSPNTSPELEAALSSLHLRDLRCQQLSLEITKLLEERDALQLKLSASLRQNQDWSRELSQNNALPNAPSYDVDNKLAELRELQSSLEHAQLSSLEGSSYNRGKRLSAEFEGSKVSLPVSPFTSHTAPSTPTNSRQADYTLTRESQGTSSTLMDWIRGKSTPKVMHV